MTERGSEGRLACLRPCEEVDWSEKKIERKTPSYEENCRGLNHWPRASDLSLEPVAGGAGVPGWRRLQQQRLQLNPCCLVCW